MDTLSHHSKALSNIESYCVQVIKNSILLTLHLAFLSMVPFSVFCDPLVTESSLDGSIDDHLCSSVEGTPFQAFGFASLLN